MSEPRREECTVRFRGIRGEADRPRADLKERTLVMWHTRSECEHDWVGWSGKARCRKCGVTRQDDVTR